MEGGGLRGEKGVLAWCVCCHCLFRDALRDVVLARSFETIRFRGLLLRLMGFWLEVTCN